jgi:undecaprenyl diphosphate synthase
MDGNGRWARQKNLIRTQGHLEGLKTAKKIVKAASDRGISFLTLYAFSTENWKRAADEVSFIMSLIKRYLIEELAFYQENQLRIRYTGCLSGVPADIAAIIQEACSKTASFPGMHVVLAINYGGRDEIVRAVTHLIAAGTLVTEENIRQNLDNPDIPDPDLIIRTAGEYRSSNFLLWEAAYAEYVISDKLWPNFSEDDFDRALSAFQNRTRRFGGVK